MIWFIEFKFFLRILQNCVLIVRRATYFWVCRTFTSTFTFSNRSRRLSKILIKTTASVAAYSFCLWLNGRSCQKETCLSLSMKLPKAMEHRLNNDGVASGSSKTKLFVLNVCYVVRRQYSRSFPLEFSTSPCISKKILFILSLFNISLANRCHFSLEIWFDVASTKKIPVLHATSINWIGWFFLMKCFLHLFQFHLPSSKAPPLHPSPRLFAQIQSFVFLSHLIQGIFFLCVHLHIILNWYLTNLRVFQAFVRFLEG